MADRGNPVTDVHRKIGVLARLDAIQEMEVEMSAVFGVGRRGSRAELQIPVKFRRHGLGRRITRRGRLPGQNHIDSLGFANPAVAHQFGHPMIHGERTVLGARLKNLAVPPNRLKQNFALVDRQRRFLALNVLARADGHHADKCMPVIRRGDHDGIAKPAMPARMN